MKKLIISLTFLSVISIVILCVTSCKDNRGNDASGFDKAMMDTTVRVQDDFYQYAVGNWVKNNPIPDDQTRWGAFNILIEEANNQVKTIVDDALTKASEGNNSLAGKVGTFYKVGMDTVRIEELGKSPLDEEIARINSISNKNDLIKQIAHMHMFNIEISTTHRLTSSPLFSFFATIDAKNSDSVIAGVSQSGLGLPDRDYYVKDDERSKEIRVKYIEYVEKMFALIGNEKSKSLAMSTMAIETRLAKASNTNLENRDPNLTYNKLTTEEIFSRYKNFDWKLYLKEIGIEDPGVIDIGQPKFIDEVDRMVNDISLDGWKTYLTWNLIRSMSPYLSSDFVNARFEFTGKFLNGQKVNQTRWKRVQATTSSVLGEAVGQLYVAKYFPPEAKAKAMEIVDALKISMAESIKGLEWMGGDTKKEALKKLDGFGVKIGYPDKWRNYRDLQFTSDSYIKNVMASNYFDHKETISQINKPVREWEWGMTPQTVNAYYSPTRNEIVFPAAILQSPFFNMNVDDAINYGGMGYVIGHEITHGFDDQGRQFDADGNIRDWWTKEDSDKFKARAQKIIDQYSAFEPLDSLFINGELTQGENIADLGGLIVSYNAFKKTEQYKKGELIDGLTPSERFYLNSAQVWKGSIRDEALETRIKTDPHSPARYRVLGSLSNIPEFYETFNVKEGDGMYRSEEERVKIW